MHQFLAETLQLSQKNKPPILLALKYHISISMLHLLLAILYEQVHGAVNRPFHLTFIDNKEIPDVGTETLTCTTKKVFKTRCLASNFLLDFSRDFPRVLPMG